MKILIAEDQPLLLESVRWKLAKAGHDVIGVVDGQQAKEFIQSEKPDVVITDLLMPFVPGHELIHYVRTELESKIPILVLSQVGLEKDILKCFQLGADDYMTKPFKPNELVARINRFKIMGRLFVCWLLLLFYVQSASAQVLQQELQDSLEIIFNDKGLKEAETWISTQPDSAVRVDLAIQLFALSKKCFDGSISFTQEGLQVSDLGYWQQRTLGHKNSWKKHTAVISASHANRSGLNGYQLAWEHYHETRKSFYINTTFTLGGPALFASSTYAVNVFFTKLKKTEVVLGYRKMKFGTTGVNIFGTGLVYYPGNNYVFLRYYLVQIPGQGLANSLVLQSRKYLPTRRGYVFLNASMGSEIERPGNTGVFSESKRMQGGAKLRISNRTSLTTSMSLEHQQFNPESVRRLIGAQLGLEYHFISKKFW